MAPAVSGLSSSGEPHSGMNSREHPVLTPPPLPAFFYQFSRRWAAPVGVKAKKIGGNTRESLGAARFGVRLGKLTWDSLILGHSTSLSPSPPTFAWCQALALAGVFPEKEVSVEALALKCFPGA